MSLVIAHYANVNKYLEKNLHLIIKYNIEKICCFFWSYTFNYLIQEFTYNFQQAIVIATLTKLIMSSLVIVTHLEPLTISGNTN